MYAMDLLASRQMLNIGPYFTEFSWCHIPPMFCISTLQSEYQLRNNLQNNMKRFVETTDIKFFLAVSLRAMAAKLQ